MSLAELAISLANLRKSPDKYTSYAYHRLPYMCLRTLVSRHIGENEHTMDLSVPKAIRRKNIRIYCGVCFRNLYDAVFTDTYFHDSLEYGMAKRTTWDIRRIAE